MTALEFELEVRRLLELSAGLLDAFAVTHRERISGVDGQYEFDVVARFQALGADFLILVECKHVGRSVEREEIQILRDRLRSVGGQKAILCSTSGFQSGAVEYASKHGIALVQVVNNEQLFVTRSKPAEPQPTAPMSFTLWDWEVSSGSRRRVMETEGAANYLKQSINGPG